MLLSKLTIDNLAIIDHLEFKPHDGLNILTGETGAGKSIIIASLNLILGNKIDKTLIRTGEDKLSVEAEFIDLDDDIKKILKENDYILFEDPLIIRRELNSSNRSRAFINDSPVKIDILSEIGKKLIDVHGQHEHQSLLDNNNHLSILDNFLDINTGGISKIYFKLINFKKELDKTIREENDLKDKKELLEYHKKEIEDVSPVIDEDILVDKELRELENIEALKKTSDHIDHITSVSANSILTSIDTLRKKCDELSDINPEFKEFEKDIDSAYTTFSEFNDSASRYVGGLEFDEERFSYLNNRLSKLAKIKKKFGPEIKDVIKYLDEINGQLDSIDNISFDIEKLNKVISDTEDQLKIICTEISEDRKKGSEDLESKINKEFKDVGLSAADISFRFNVKDISENGMDDVELFIRTNIGEDSKPLSKIVSGGEVSRIMLAIKNIISKKKGINILIFDEIDSGISGRIAEKVGSKLEQLSRNKQLFVITHLPAIASKGDIHFSVRKEVNNNKTTVKIKKLEGSDRLKEIDSLVSGDKTTEENKLDKTHETKNPSQDHDILFQSLNIIKPILKAIKEEGYTIPTPIQAQCIPVVLKGTDVLGCAQTGTGKTAAFAIPILQLLSAYNTFTGKRKIKSLIVTPTRELAIQIGESFEAYGRHTGLKCTVIFGGVKQHSQVNALKSGVDIVVATPGRLLDLMNQGYLNLRDVRYFVLDEADRMLDMGFIHDVKKMIAVLPKKRQSLFFSATMPKEIVSLAGTILDNPIHISVTPVSSTVEIVKQCVYFVDKGNKSKLLLEVLKDNNIHTALVFTRTKYGADKLVKILHKNNIKAEAIHGNKSQNARQRALSNFKAKTTRVLLATDIAARGIDIDEMEYVINYEIPNISETYVHRIGRTARAGAEGTAISFCDADEKPFLKDIEKLIKKKIEIIEDHPFPLIDHDPVKPVKQPRNKKAADKTKSKSYEKKSKKKWHGKPKVIR